MMLRTGWVRSIAIAAVVLVAWMLPVQTATAQEAGLPYLRLSADASAMAMGDAQAAFSRGSFAALWNPAGIAIGRGSVGSISHYRWVADVNSYALGIRLDAGAQGAFGIMATGVLDAGADLAGDLDSDGLDNAFISAGVGYGRRLGPVRAGVTAKYLAQRVEPHSAHGYAFDFGLQADLIRGGLVAGLALQHVGRMSELDAGTTPLPRTIRGGLAIHPFQVMLAEDGDPFISGFATIEWSHVFPAEETHFHAGVGAEILEFAVLRAGLVTNDEVRRFSFGGGLRYAPLEVDYAFLPFRGGFGGAGHVLTMAYRW